MPAVNVTPWLARPLLTWLFAVVVVAVGIGLRYPWPADEPRFALIGLEMLTTGDWLFPHRGGELYPDKPPLFMWLQALAFAGAGDLRWSFLLPSVLASLGSLWLVRDLARRLYGASAGWAAMLLLLATLQFMAQAKSAQIDAVLCGFTTLALYGLARHLLQGPSPGWYAVAWLAMGAGVITKGVGFLPVFFLPGFALAQSLRRRRALPVRSASAQDYWAPALILVPILAWLLPMLLVVAASGDPALAAYRDEILLRQTATRYVAGLGHDKPPTFYLFSVIPAMWLPLSALLPWLAPVWYRRLRELEPAAWALLGYAGLGLLFFSLSPGKRGVYLLPLLPALAVVSAPEIAALCRRRGILRLGRLLLAVIGLVLLLGAALALAGWERGLEQLAKVALQPALAAAVLAASGAAVLACLALRDIARSYLAAMAVIWTVASCVVYPLIDPMRSGQSLMQAVNQRLAVDDELAIADFREQLLLHAGRPVVHWGYHSDRVMQVRDAAHWLAEAPDRYLLIPEYIAGYCFHVDPQASLGRRHRRNWLLLRAAAIDPGKPECRQGKPELPRYVSPALRLNRYR